MSKRVSRGIETSTKKKKDPTKDRREDNLGMKSKVSIEVTMKKVL